MIKFAKSLYLGLLASVSIFQSQAANSNGLAPEVTDLNAKDVSYQLEQKMKYLHQPFISTRPQEMGDGLAVGELGIDSGDKDAILAFAESIAKATDTLHRTDSLLISHKGKLLFESYYRRGRENYPHYQMSITKSYTALAIGRAIQLGYLSMDDLNKPVVSFLKELNTSTFVKGVDKITLNQAMTMNSGIRLNKSTINELIKNRDQLRGQGQIQAYFQHTDQLQPGKFKYQAADPSITMQVLESVVPGSAKEFIKKELLGKMGIANYAWQSDLSGLPKSAAGSSIRSRDMMKIGQMIINKGQWQGEQLIPKEYIERATSPVVHSYGTSYYGYFWWVNDYTVNGKKYTCKAGRGAGGQFILMFPDIDLIAVITAHNEGMGTMLKEAPKMIIPAFTVGDNE